MKSRGVDNKVKNSNRRKNNHTQLKPYYPHLLPQEKSVVQKKDASTDSLKESEFMRISFSVEKKKKINLL